jgi:hypothetical protein
MVRQRENDVWSSVSFAYMLNELIPNKREDLRTYNLRNDQHINLINCKTTRFSKSFIPSSIVSYRIVSFLLVSYRWWSTDVYLVAPISWSIFWFFEIDL